MNSRQSPIVAKTVKKAGGPVALSRALGCSPQAISRWRRIPAERVLAVAEAAGMNPSDLRPDLYPPAKGRKAA